MDQPRPRLMEAARRFVPALIVAAALAACDPVAATVGAGATVGVASSQERGVGGAAGDASIRAEINYYWLKHDEEMYGNVGLTVHEGRVLLTGKVKTPQQRLDAVRLAWKADGVKEVINEIKVTEEGSVGNYARDVWISTQLRTKILFDEDISSINYSVETVDQTVYLMGIAQDRAELDRVTAHARNLAHVRKVIIHVRVKDAAEGGNG